jgi:hypothetical protein
MSYLLAQSNYNYRRDRKLVRNLRQEPKSDRLLEKQLEKTDANSPQDAIRRDFGISFRHPLVPLAYALGDAHISVRQSDSGRILRFPSP